MREVIITSILWGFDQKNHFFEGRSWFKLRFNNLGLALTMALEFHTSVTKNLKLKARKFWGLIPSFVKVTGEKLVRGTVLVPHPETVNKKTFSLLSLCFIKRKLNLFVRNLPQSNLSQPEGSWLRGPSGRIFILLFSKTPWWSVKERVFSR